MPSTLILPAPAKLNLFLYVIGRRSDGYHLLQTVFQLLDFGDELLLEEQSGGAITVECNIATLKGENNLVFNAAQILRQRVGVEYGARIAVNKRLPMGGGIGGGSSDAATTLLGLNYLWRCGLDENELAELGKALGADVPVFIRGRSSWAEGVGEVLQAIELPEVYYLVVTPKIEVSTAQVFAHPELTRGTTAITVAAFLAQGSHTKSTSIVLRNDCEALVAKLYPEVAEVIAWLGHFAPARLTGTGASVFAPFESEQAAQIVKEKCPWPAFVAKGINQSPVHSSISRLETRD